MTTIFDLVDGPVRRAPRSARGLPGESYDDDTPYTPAWSEKYTGMSREMVIRFAREWASTAELTKGKCTIIIGAGINHWYHANLMYRAGIHALMLCGCVGVNGGGLAHYVGQEKLAPGESWGTIWPLARTGGDRRGYRTHPVGTTCTPTSGAMRSPSRTITRSLNRRTAPWPRVTPWTCRCGRCATAGCRFYPQFDRNTLELVAEARAAGAESEKEIVDWVVEKLKSRELKFAVEDPDAPRTGRGSGTSGAATP